MRLLVVSQYFWPENFRINDLAAELVARGHSVTVLTGVPNYPEGAVYQPYQAQPAQFAHHAGARIVRVPMLGRGRGSLRLVLNYLSFALSAHQYQLFIGGQTDKNAFGHQCRTKRRQKCHSCQSRGDLGASGLSYRPFGL